MNSRLWFTALIAGVGVERLAELVVSRRNLQRSIERGGYVAHRVFFADEATAVAAGYRPCARCLPDAYRAWKAARPTASNPKASTIVRPDRP